MGFPVLVKNVFVCSIVVVMEPDSSSNRNRVFDYMSTQLIISHRRINKQQNKYTPVTNRCQKPWQLSTTHTKTVNIEQSALHRILQLATF